MFNLTRPSGPQPTNGAPTAWGRRTSARSWSRRRPSSSERTEALTPSPSLRPFRWVWFDSVSCFRSPSAGSFQLKLLKDWPTSSLFQSIRGIKHVKLKSCATFDSLRSLLIMLLFFWKKYNFSILLDQINFLSKTTEDSTCSQIRTQFQVLF